MKLECKPKYKVGKEVKIKGSKTIGKIASIEFDEDIKQYAYEVLTEAKFHYTVLESEIKLVDLTTKKNNTKPKYKVGQLVKYKDYKFNAIGYVFSIAYDKEIKSFCYLFEDKKFKRELPILIYEKDIIKSVNFKTKKQLKKI